MRGQTYLEEDESAVAEAEEPAEHVDHFVGAGGEGGIAVDQNELPVAEGLEVLSIVQKWSHRAMESGEAPQPGHDELHDQLQKRDHGRHLGIRGFILAGHQEVHVSVELAPKVLCQIERRGPALEVGAQGLLDSFGFLWLRISIELVRGRLEKTAVPAAGS
jgi:hypothetical protein